MIKQLTLIITFFCVLYAHAQESSLNTLEDMMSWLEVHADNSKDSTQLGHNSRRAITLSKQANDQIALAQSRLEMLPSSSNQDNL